MPDKDRKDFIVITMDIAINIDDNPDNEKSRQFISDLESGKYNTGILLSYTREIKTGVPVSVKSVKKESLTLNDIYDRAGIPRDVRPPQDIVETVAAISQILGGITVH